MGAAVTRPLSEVYAKAATLVRAGWVKGHYRAGDCYCALGALIAASGPDFEVDAWAQGTVEAENELARPLAEEIGDFGPPKRAIINWNDTRAASAEDVARAMDRAWAKLKEAGR